MGETHDTIATSVDAKKDSEYGIWMREQLLVLVSRVRSLDGILFIGERNAVISAIRSIYTMRSIVDRNEGVLEVMGNAGPRMVQTRVAYPQESVVYALVSMQYPRSFYVGQTINMRRRIAEHNHGNGAAFTVDNNRRPWAVVLVVYGWDEGDDAERRRRAFETEMHGVIQGVHHQQLIELFRQHVARLDDPRLTLHVFRP
jgi:predicted GIY-YIG superfamily endonuclease